MAKRESVKQKHQADPKNELLRKGSRSNVLEVTDKPNSSLDRRFVGWGEGETVSFPSRKGKGKMSVLGFGFEFHSIRQPDRTRERNETKRFPGWTHSPSLPRVTENEHSES